MKMKKKMNLQTKFAYGYIGVVAVGFLCMYSEAARNERQKRKKIREWELMNKSAITASRRRLADMALDPDVTSHDMIVAFREETQFLNIVQNQPMY